MNLKKLICLMLSGALAACALSGCSRTAPSGDTGEEPPKVTTDAPSESYPAEGPHGETYQTLEESTLPTVEPMARIDVDNFDLDNLLPSGQDYDMTGDEIFGALDEPVSDAPASNPGESALNPSSVAVIDPNTFQFAALTDTQMGFTFNYPAQWENLPGIYTVCYRERVEDGSFPARVSVTRKKLKHTVEGTVLNDELKEFVKVVAKQYDSSTFQLGTASTAESFLGRTAISDTYLAYSGDTEVKGFIIGTSVGMYLLVFHFCASYDDYTAMERVMKYMVRSVQAAS